MKIFKEKAKWKVRVLKIFHAQLHSKLNYLRCMIKIKHSQHSYSIFNFVFKNKTERNRNDEKHKQTSIIVKIHTNTNVSKRNSLKNEFGGRYPYNTRLEHFDFLFVM